MLDINEYIKDFEMFRERANYFEKEQKLEDAIKFYNKAKSSIESIIKLEENKCNHQIYEQKLTDMKKQIEELEKKKKKLSNTESGDDENKKLKEQLNDILDTKIPKVSWDDIVGLENAKQALKESVILPILYPQLFEGKRRIMRKAILLYGPSGTGKSYLAKAVATEIKGKFFSVSAANIAKNFVESEKLIKALFELAIKNKPSVIFIDEIDCILGKKNEGDADVRHKLIKEFLERTQGMGKDDSGILVLGATNIPWELDTVVRRRFHRKIYVSLPETKTRKLMIKLFLGNTNNDLTDEQFEILGNLTEGYSGSDIYNLTQDVIHGASKKCQRRKNDIPNSENLVVTFEDFNLSLQNIKPTVSKKDLERHDQFTKEFVTEG